MPSSLGVGHGKVYDAYGDESGQVDLVITNPEHPFKYPPHKAGAYIIEGISAVAEIKSVLTTGELDNCIKAGAKYKRLRPTFYELDVPSSPDPKTAALLIETAAIPPFFVLAFENNVAIETVLQRLRDAEAVQVPIGKAYTNGIGNSPQPPIDCVRLLGQGLLLKIRPSDGLISATVDGQPATGWVHLETQAPLAWTLGWLNVVMPRYQRSRSVLSYYLQPAEIHRDYMAATTLVQQDDSGDG